MPEPWYADGLAFTCTRCGDCCTGAPGFVWISEEEIVALAKHLGETPALVRDLYTWEAGRERSLREKDHGDCIFFKRGEGCTIYPVRPQQCRTWPFWESNVRSPEAWEETRAVCPGSGRGQLISSEEITRRLNLRRL